MALTLKIECVRYSVGEHGPATAGQPVSVYTVGAPVQIVFGLAGRDADEYSCAGTADCGRVDACKQCESCESAVERFRRGRKVTGRSYLMAGFLVIISSIIQSS